MNLFSMTELIHPSLQLIRKLSCQLHKFKIFTSFVMLFSLHGVMAQSANYEWAFHMGNSSIFENDFGESITVDSNGDIIVVEMFHDSIDCDPGLGENYLYSNGYLDCFIQKLDPNKNLIWAKRIGGNGDDKAFSLSQLIQTTTFTLRDHSRIR